MTTQTLTVAEFLLVRISEDEEIARRSHGGWIEFGDGVRVTLDNAGLTRVLAECMAKRGIVRLHDSVSAGRSDVRRSCPLCQWERDPGWGTDEWPCETLLWLAAPYADHPDFRQEWAL